MNCAVPLTWQHFDVSPELVDGALQHAAPSGESLEELRFLLVDDVHHQLGVLGGLRKGLALGGREDGGSGVKGQS